MWEQYSRMKESLNKTGRPIWYSITQLVEYNDTWSAMHCVPGKAFTVRPWVRQGLDPTQLANSYLIEYCNNEDQFGRTAGRGGFLSQLDAQQLLTYDNETVPGAYSDMDMLENCNAHGSHNRDKGQTQAEYRSQFSTFAILSSPLILGNDPRNMSSECLEIIGNREVIAISQDARVARAKLVFQWPDPEWPNASVLPPSMPPSPETRAELRDWSVSGTSPTVNITLQVWARSLHDGGMGVVAFNRGRIPANISLTWEALGISAGTEVTVRDLWAHRDLGRFKGSYECVGIAPHDSSFLKLTPTAL